MDDLIKLSVGEPDFPTPEHICEAACRAVAEGYTRYTPQPGFEDLREAVARHPFQLHEHPHLQRPDGSYTNW